LVAAGFVAASREYACRDAVDPFRQLKRARKEILHEVGWYYFGSRESAAVRKKWAKDACSRAELTAEFERLMPAMCEFVHDFLQHDGIVLAIPDGTAVAAVTAALTAASSAVLGYEQPVEEKPLGEEVSGSESEGDGTEA